MSRKTTRLGRQRSGFNGIVKIFLYVGGIGAFILLSTVIFMEFVADAPPPPADQQMEESAEGAQEEGEEFEEPEEHKLIPPALSSNATTPGEEEPGVHRGVIESGETAGTLLQAWLPAGEVNSLVNACSPVFSLRKLRAGQPYAIIEDEHGFSRFEYEIDDSKKLVVCREASDFVATLEHIEYDILLERVQGTIEGSLFESMANLGETPVLAVRLAEIFAWEINFIRDIQPDDSFSVLVEKRYRNGEFNSYGKLLAASFVNQGSKYEAFAFSDSFGNTDYYNAAGDSVKRAFLKAPLSFTRISSRFSMSRMHPVLHYSRPHPAIDYAAPTGTPVKAIGNGEVTFSGWGKGAGNYISLRHTGGYESMYLHLSAFAKGLRKGARVRQGEVIGFVGSTGYSTGPHLDFRMKKNEQFINPEKVLSPRADSVDEKTIQRFKATRDLYRQYIEGKKSLTEYTLEKENPRP